MRKAKAGMGTASGHGRGRVRGGPSERLWRQRNVIEPDEDDVDEPLRCTDCGTEIGPEPYGMCARCRAVDAWEANHAG